LLTDARILPLSIMVGNTISTVQSCTLVKAFVDSGSKWPSSPANAYRGIANNTQLQETAVLTPMMDHA
jgi:hypothetical protein